ncbi:MAG: elongation factor P maturation arginine rhamnosyltransferase EarP [Rhodoferax sp.]
MIPTLPQPQLRWDVFCRVIDNYGDVGVCWRLARGLAARGQTVRLWLDDDHALRWMAPQGCPGVRVRPWAESSTEQQPGDVMIEAFGCEIDPNFVVAYADYIRARSKKCHWINLEYLSAEAYAARCHRLPSPVLHGPGQGLTKHFFYPGFTPATGGLLREPDVLARQKTFDAQAWLQARGLWQAQRLRISLFCYEPAALGTLLRQLAQHPQPTQLLVTPGRAQAAVRACVAEQNAIQPNWNMRGQLLISELDWLSQDDFDALLWACDLNAVRGEDSLVRALWAGRPLLWQLYPQDDGAHQAKLTAFLDWLGAEPALRQSWCAWNGLAPKETLSLHTLLASGALWTQARQRLLAQADLVSQLLEFVGAGEGAAPVASGAG